VNLLAAAVEGGLFIWKLMRRRKKLMTQEEKNVTGGQRARNSSLEMPDKTNRAGETVKPDTHKKKSHTTPGFFRPIISERLKEGRAHPSDSLKKKLKQRGSKRGRKITRGHQETVREKPQGRIFRPGQSCGFDAPMNPGDAERGSREVKATLSSKGEKTENSDKVLGTRLVRARVLGKPAWERDRHVSHNFGPRGGDSSRFLKRKRVPNGTHLAAFIPLFCQWPGKRGKGGPDETIFVSGNGEKKKKGRASASLRST